MTKYPNLDTYPDLEPYRQEDMEGPCVYCRLWTSVEDGALLDTADYEEGTASPGTVAIVMAVQDSGVPAFFMGKEVLVCPNCQEATTTT